MLIANHHKSESEEDMFLLFQKGYCSIFIIPPCLLYSCSANNYEYHTGSKKKYMELQGTKNI